MVQRVLICVVVVACCLEPGERSFAQTTKSKSLINAIGDYSLFNRVLAVSVFKEQGKLKYRIIRKFRDKELTHSKTIEFVEDGGWFIFPESPDAVWLFDGNKTLVIVRFKENDGMTSSYADSSTLPSAEALKSAPKLVVDSLPAALREVDKE